MKAFSGADCRCECGSLAARLGVRGVELKCRRCKRILLVPWSAAGRWREPLPDPLERAGPLYPRVRSR